MKNEDTTNLSLDELKKKEKSAQLSTSLLIGIVIVQCITGVYLTIVQGFSIFTVMPLIFFPIAIMSYKNLKKLRQVIASKSK